MKRLLIKTAAILACISVSFSLTACGTSSNDSAVNDPSASGGDKSVHKDFFDSQSSVFHSIEAHEDENVITANFDVYLSETEAAFLFVEAKEEMDVTLHYTYTTQDQSGVELGHYLDGSGEKSVIELAAATEQAYDSLWTDEKISLKKGMNVFFLSGNDITCKMKFEINGFDHDKISYASAFDKDQKLEDLKDVPPLD